MEEQRSGGGREQHVRWELPSHRSLKILSDKPCPPIHNQPTQNPKAKSQKPPSPSPLYPSTASSPLSSPSPSHPPNMPNAIALHQVDKVYNNGTVALQGVDLKIRQGEFVSLVGPSGCGKSTVLRLIAGLGEPSAGGLEWGNWERGASNGNGTGEAEGARGGVGRSSLDKPSLAYVFQDAALMPWATVVDNVHLPLKLKGKSLRSSRSHIQEALNLVDLQGFEHSYPRQLSGGMKMRVSIARSLVTQPDLLLMDEPFGALDEMTRGRLNSDLLHLWERYHWTVVFVTHNIYEAVYLANRVVVMAAHPGRIVADVPIDAPHPRGDAFRTSPLFNEYCRAILQHLHTS